MLSGFDYLLKTRGLTKEVIRTFHLGYCDNDNNIYVDTQFPSTTLTLDYKFKESVIFPINNVYGDMIGVSARKLNHKTNQDLKYVNTVYPKTDHLYGLNVTWKDCVKERKAYVVEGNVDTLIMYQFGIKNVVGMLGSSLKIKQVTLLSRYVDEIILVPDGDTSGNNLIKKLVDGSLRGKPKEHLALLKKYHNLDIKFTHLQLPEGYDPDKFLFEKGKEALLNLPKISLNASLLEGVIYE